MHLLCGAYRREYWSLSIISTDSSVSFARRLRHRNCLCLKRGNNIESDTTGTTDYPDCSDYSSRRLAQTGADFRRVKSLRPQLAATPSVEVQISNLEAHRSFIFHLSTPKRSGTTTLLISETQQQKGCTAVHPFCWFWIEVIT